MKTRVVILGRILGDHEISFAGKYQGHPVDCIVSEEKHNLTIGDDYLIDAFIIGLENKNKIMRIKIIKSRRI